MSLSIFLLKFLSRHDIRGVLCPLSLNKFRHFSAGNWFPRFSLHSYPVHTFFKKSSSCSKLFCSLPHHPVISPYTMDLPVPSHSLPVQMPVTALICLENRVSESPREHLEGLPQTHSSTRCSVLPQQSCRGHLGLLASRWATDPLPLVLSLGHIRNHVM